MLIVAVKNILPPERGGGQQGGPIRLEGPTLTPSTMVPSAPSCYAPAALYNASVKVELQQDICQLQLLHAEP